MISKKRLLAQAAFAGLVMVACKDGGNTAANEETGAVSNKPGKCLGANECAGKSDCHSAQNASCAGKNSCKGKGWIRMGQADCEKKGFKFEKI